jgi:energy-coupling factor transporter ATP-binding protein EcfA2
MQVQTRKIVGNKRHGYWEPSRIALKEGMEPMPSKDGNNDTYMSSTGDRWTPVRRTPLYFNGKTDASAFDRFFNSPSELTLEEKQDKFVKYSRHLKTVIDNSLLNYEYYSKERVEQNFMLSDSQLSIVNRILQKKYLSARYVTHKFYDGASFSPSVVFETDTLNYSECFAGSGELAVVNLVLALEKAEKYDLVLLDEPETSLHPGAQRKLVEYLLILTRQKFLQVIIATHSSTMVDLLPNAALVVLVESIDGIHPRMEPTKGSAFYRLGALPRDEIVILTEDKLLKVLAERALERLPADLRSNVKVRADDVGASEMLSNQVRALSMAGSKAIMILDGDQRPIAKIFNQDFNLLSATRHSELIKELYNLNVSIVGTAPDPNDDLRDWMEWCTERVILIDEVCAEKVFLSVLNPEHGRLKTGSSTNKQFKSAVKSELSKSNNEKTSDAQAVIFKLKLGEAKPGSDADKSIVALSKSLETALARFGDD